MRFFFQKLKLRAWQAVFLLCCAQVVACAHGSLNSAVVKTADGELMVLGTGLKDSEVLIAGIKKAQEYCLKRNLEAVFSDADLNARAYFFGYPSVSPQAYADAVSLRFRCS